MKNYLTIDIGGTFVKYSVVSEDFHITKEGEMPTEPETEAFRKQLVNLALEYRDSVCGIAACIAGFINPVTGENTDYSVGQRFRDFNIKEELHVATGLPVTLENDSNCALLGEMAFGAAKDAKTVALLTIGTGVGGAIAIDGRLHRGSHCKAGEADFMLVSDQKAGATSVLCKRVSEVVGMQVDGKYVFEHLNEEPIHEIYWDWLTKLAPVVGTFSVLLDPEVILIGGGICAQEQFIEDLRKVTYEKFSHLEDYTEIRACRTGNMAGRLGALSLFLNNEAS